MQILKSQCYISQEIYKRTFVYPFVTNLLYYSHKELTYFQKCAGINVLYDYAPQFQSRRGKEIYVHENYNASSFNNTIALIELDRPVDISDYVRPICLWNDDNGKFEKIIGRIGKLY